MSHFKVGPRYEVLKHIVSDAFGVLVKANDKRTGGECCIMKLNEIDHIDDAKMILRELRILRFFRHENLISPYNVLLDEDSCNFGRIYLVTNSVDVTLNDVVRNKQALTDDHVQFIVYQIVRALLYLHSANTIHRDLRPANILGTLTCDIQLCDFGFAKAADFSAYKKEAKEGSECFRARAFAPGLRYYEAPEIVLECETTTAIDMWSLGCIMAELMTGKILFKGDCYISQIKAIVESLGRPQDLSFVKNKNALKFFQSLPEKATKPLLSNIEYKNQEAIDLLTKLLEVDPAKRINAADAIRHPYLKAFHEPADEPVYQGRPDLKFENDPYLTLEEIFLLIIDEINYYKRDNDEEEVDKDKYIEIFVEKASKGKRLIVW